MGKSTLIKNLYLIMGSERNIDVLLLLIKMKSVLRAEAVELQVKLHLIHRTTAYRTLNRLSRLNLVEKRYDSNGICFYSVPRPVKKLLLHLLRLQGQIKIETTPLEVHKTYWGSKVTYTTKKGISIQQKDPKILLEPDM